MVKPKWSENPEKAGFVYQEENEIIFGETFNSFLLFRSLLIDFV